MSKLAGRPRISPFLWFDGNAEEAASFYIGIFPNSSRLDALTQGGPGGKPLTVAFQLDGLHFTALNGGPGFPFNEAVSFVVLCEDQAEIDFYWQRLSEGGKESRCGWLKDRFGLSWQIVPANMAELLRRPGAMEAMMRMAKLDIAALESAGRV